MYVACTDFQRLPVTVSLKHSVADTTVSRHAGTQRVRPALGRVSPSALQVTPESVSHSAVTNRLIRGYRLKEFFPWKWVFKSDQRNPKQKFEIWQDTF